jgi:hypothetical protein
MAHFAQMTNSLVSDVIVVSNDDCDNLPFPESEPVGQAFIASLGLTGEWLQTSYSGSFRGLYAGIDYTFNESLGEYGEFVAPVYPTVE